MLEQAKNARDALIASGLKRKDFKVRTERLMNGSVFCGFGDAKIHLKDIEALERAVKCTPSLLEHGFSVTHCHMNTMILVYIYDDDKGVFKEEDYRS